MSARGRRAARSSCLPCYSSEQWPLLPPRPTGPTMPAPWPGASRTRSRGDGATVCGLLSPDKLETFGGQAKCEHAFADDSSPDAEAITTLVRAYTAARRSAAKRHGRSVTKSFGSSPPAAPGPAFNVSVGSLSFVDEKAYGQACLARPTRTSRTRSIRF